MNLTIEMRIFSILQLLHLHLKYVEIHLIGLLLDEKFTFFF